MPRQAEQVIVIMWRDIPAQVNGQVGRDRHQVVLSEKFQRAIDRAKRKAKIHTAHEDVAQWRRVSRPPSGELRAAAQAEADRIEASYSQERLGLLAFAGGWEHDVNPASEADSGPHVASESLQKRGSGGRGSGRA